MDSHQYEPLPDNFHCIRLISIQPADKPTTMLSIGLQVVPFDSGNLPQYETLSYVWGSERNPETIYVNDGSRDTTSILTITQSLHVALQSLRNATKPRVMWIDAVCINQEDEIEKGPQIALMGEIYRRSSRVVVWLGPEIEGSTRAMSLMHRLSSLVRMDHKTGVWTPTAEARSATERSFADRFAPLEWTAQDELDVYRLLCRPWFERLWVRQEICPATTATVLCGTFEVPWASFHRALHCIYTKPLAMHDIGRQLQSRLISLTGFIYQQNPVSLVTLRETFGTSLCRDAKDRVYAVLSLLCEEEKAIISIDYSRTAGEIFHDAVVGLVVRTHSLDILRQCQLAIDDDPRGCIPNPSWIPDWSIERSRAISPVPLQFSSSRLFACHEFPEPKGNVIRVAGVHVASIEDIEQIGITESDTHKEVARELHRILQKPGPKEKYRKYGMESVEAFTSSIIMGRYTDKREFVEQSLPERHDAVNFVCRLISNSEAPDFDGSENSNRFLNQAGAACAYKSLFTGAENLVGLAPILAQKGDHVCVFLGCNSPILLRSVGGEQFKIVCDSFVSGLESGEALLGALPKNIETVWCRRDDNGSWGFRDISSGYVGFEDPRILKLARAVTDCEQTLGSQTAWQPWSKFYIAPEALGGNIRYFDLL